MRAGVPAVIVDLLGRAAQLGIATRAVGGGQADCTYADIDACGGAGRNRGVGHLASLARHADSSRAVAAGAARVGAARHASKVGEAGASSTRRWHW